MDTDSIESRTRQFLKNEWFWAAIVAIAVATSLFQDAARFQEQGQTRLVQQSEAVDLKKLMWSWREGILFQRGAQHALFPLMTRLINVALLLGGAFLLAALAIVRIQRRLLTPALTRPPVWNLWDVLKIGAIYSLGIFFFGWIFAPSESTPLADSRGWYVEIFARILLIGSIVNVVIGERDGRWGDLGARGRVAVNLLIGAIAFVALQPVLWLINASMFLTLRTIPLQPALQTMLESKSALVIGLSIFTALVITPLSEELLFRAYLQPALEKRFGGMIGVILSAVLFAAAHRDLFVIIPMFVFGLTAGYLYNRTRSLTAPICMHVLFNLVTILRILSAR